MAKMLACTNPLALLCIAIDGADQSAFATPYFCQETKDSVKGWKMKMKLIGALVSGRMCMFYTLGTNWESGQFRARSRLHHSFPAAFSISYAVPCSLTVVLLSAAGVCFLSGSFVLLYIMHKQFFILD